MRPAPGPVRTGVATAISALALVLVWVAVVAPDHPNRLTLGGFARLPLELLAVVALNILVWRALVPGLARLAPSTRVVAIVGIGLAIAGVSVILLAGLLWAGVIAILLLEGFS